MWVEDDVLNMFLSVVEVVVNALVIVLDYTENNDGVEHDAAQSVSDVHSLEASSMTPM